MKLVSWNVNGLRASWEKGLLDYISSEAADVYCLQEIKIQEHQLTFEHRSPAGYKSYWFPAEKPGYSGVATYTNREPLRVFFGMEKEEFDREGRVLTLEFEDFFLVNAYFPNSQRDHARLPYKLSFCEEILGFCESLRRQKKGVVLCGDYNIAHKEIDLKNPKTNVNNAGFLPQERAWMDAFLRSGYEDAFRRFEPSAASYTWWSYRPGVRERNIGWRIDYHCYSQELADRVVGAEIHDKIMGSDHCPIRLVVK